MVLSEMCDKIIFRVKHFSEIPKIDTDDSLHNEY